jgi:hypothetical protein
LEFGVNSAAVQSIARGPATSTVATAPRPGGVSRTAQVDGREASSRFASGPALHDNPELNDDTVCSLENSDSPVCDAAYESV